jgi:hypothetical protein
VHTASWIVEKCLRGDMLRGRTVILVVIVKALSPYRTVLIFTQTHNVALTTPIADYVVSMGSNGKVAIKGVMADALRDNHELKEIVKKDEEAVMKEKEEVDKAEPEQKMTSDDSKGKLVVAEEIAIGRVRWGALRHYVFGIGGFIVWTFIIINGLGASALNIGQVYYLGYWARQYENRPANEVDVPL